MKYSFSWSDTESEEDNTKKDISNIISKLSSSENEEVEQEQVQIIKIKRKKKNSRFQCDICSKKFVTKAVLQKHRNNIHSAEKKFQCKICLKLFADQFSMRSVV